MEAAAALFAELGYDGASTRKLGQAAGANIATIAYHFGGKEGLYHAALGRMYARVLAFEPQVTGDDPAARLRGLMAQLWRFCRTERSAVRLLLRHVADHGSLPTAVRDESAAQAMGRAMQLQQALGLPDLAERRLELLSLNHLLARYTISSVEDLRPFAGEGDVDEVVGRHLGDVAVRLLL